MFSSSIIYILHFVFGKSNYGNYDPLVCSWCQEVTIKFLEKNHENVGFALFDIKWRSECLAKQ